ncbi:MAG: hypothetical protein LBS79_11625, partial [Tannerella sp.]|nr:hypothetical protein [Tannerella sp.]
MKIRITKRTVLMLAFSAFFFINVKAQIVTGVQLNKDTITLGVDSMDILVANVLPSDAANKSVEWKITDVSKIDTVMTDDTTCMITGKVVGETKLIVRTHPTNYRDTCVIKVIIPVDSVRLKDHSLDMILGHDTTL